KATSYDYELQWAPGLQPPAYPESDTWHTVASRAGLTAPVDGTLGNLDLADVAASLPDGGRGAPVDATTGNRPAEDRFDVRLRVVVHARGGSSDGLEGEMQKQVFVHDDPDLMSGFPRKVPGAGSSSQRFVDLNGDGVEELLVATSDGTIHAFEPDGSELAGFPVTGDPAPFWPTGSATGRRAGIPAPAGAFVLGAPAVGDLYHDGRLEVVDADIDGRVYVWSANGTRLATMHTNPAWSRDSAETQDEFNRTQPGFLSAPALGDLDGDGALEIVAAAMDRHVYAWHADGTPVAGFPVLVVDPDTTTAVDPTSHRVTFDPASNPREGGSLIATPTLADLDGDGHPDIVIGAQEEYRGDPGIGGDGSDMVGLLASAASPGTSRVYAISSKGTNARSRPIGSANPDAGAYLAGWPVAVPMIQTEALPTIGDGIVMPAVVGDIVPSRPGPEVAVASATGPLMVYGADGTPAYGSTSQGGVPLIWAAGLGNARAGQFGAHRNSEDLAATLVAFSGPSLGDLSGAGSVDVAVPTLGLSRMLDINLPDHQLPADDQVMAWRGSDGSVLAGFPQTVSDMSFFVQPSIADIDGDGRAEVISGNGVNTLTAFDAQGISPARWPKLTGGWSVGTPAVGDWSGNGTLMVAQARRDGVLSVWRTGSRTPPQWASFNCDASNSGAASQACTRSLRAVPPISSTLPAPTTSVASTGPGPAVTSGRSSRGGAPVDGVGGSGVHGTTLPSTGARLDVAIRVGVVAVALGLVLVATRRRRGVAR
ncbi:MAG: VCBS repeat-containing protein, partial [Actinobacteria bacterium]|nr:VCBS repeat-containing protein [Actinomycetota bacterium]